VVTVLSAALVYGLTGGLAPGPLMTLVLTQTLRHGAREGIRTSLAPLITDGPIVAFILLALGRIASMRPLIGAIGIAGTIYILRLAWESWTSEPRNPAAEAAEAPRSVLRGVAVNVLNPNPYLFWLTAGTPMLVKAWQEGWLVAAGFIAIFFASLVGSKIALALAFARSRERIVGNWYRPVMRVLAGLLVVFAGLIGWDAIRLLR
jgi:threonine/homoserine/homoserine lactone efflux protein